MSRQLSNASRHLRRATWWTLSVLLIGFPLVTHAAEAPGALTVIVKDQITDRPLPDAQITIYTVSVAKGGLRRGFRGSRVNGLEPLFDFRQPADDRAFQGISRPV